MGLDSTPRTKWRLDCTAGPSVFACPVCTQLDWSRALCDECADELWRRREPTVRDLGAYRTCAPFAWRRDGWPALRWWASALKGKEHPVFWREPATWLIDVFGPPPAGAVLVPIPAERRRNHARGLAFALAGCTGAPVADVLGVVTRGHQRRRDRLARRRRRYALVGNPPRGPVVVIDDVITSGATIEAAYRALGQPAEFAAWCLLDRRPAI